MCVLTTFFLWKTYICKNFRKYFVETNCLLWKNQSVLCGLAFRVRQSVFRYFRAIRLLLKNQSVRCGIAFRVRQSAFRYFRAIPKSIFSENCVAHKFGPLETDHHSGSAGPYSVIFEQFVVEKPVRPLRNSIPGPSVRIPLFSSNSVLECTSNNNERKDTTRPHTKKRYSNQCMQNKGG